MYKKDWTLKVHKIKYLYLIPLPIAILTFQVLNITWLIAISNIHIYAGTYIHIHIHIYKYLRLWWVLQFSLLKNCSGHDLKDEHIEKAWFLPSKRLVIGVIPVCHCTLKKNLENIFGNRDFQDPLTKTSYIVCD